MCKILLTQIKQSIMPFFEFKSSIGVSGSGNGGLSASINKIDGQQQQQHSSQFQSEPQLRGLSNGNGGFVGRGMGGVGTTGGIQQTSPKDYANGRNAGTVGYQVWNCD